jgi:hypothetical protein
MARWTLSGHLSERDFDQIAALVATEETGRPALADALARDDALLDAALAHPAVVEAVLGPAPSGEAQLSVASPELYFAVLLVRARHDLAEALSIPEWTDRDMSVPLFDAAEARRALDQVPLRRYLGRLLASYVHVTAAPARVAARPSRGAHRRPRFHELDLGSMLELARVTPAATQPAVLCRTADLALFLAGLFPRQVVAEAGEAGLAAWEQHGQGLYHAAAVGYEDSHPGWAVALDDMAEYFHPSRRALNFVAQRYLRAS